MTGEGVSREGLSEGGLEKEREGGTWGKCCVGGTAEARGDRQGLFQPQALGQRASGVATWLPAFGEDPSDREVRNSGGSFSIVRPL